MYSASLHTCSICDKSYSRRYDLERHQNTIHAEDIDDSQEEEEESEMEESIQSDVSENESSESETDEGDSDMVTDEESSSDELEDNPAFKEWYQQAMDEMKEARDKKFQKYVDEGMEGDRAKEEAHAKTISAVQRIFFEKYRSHMWSAKHLKDDETHQEILEDLEGKMSEGKDVYKTLKRLMAKYKHKFDGLFVYDESDDEDTGEQEDMEDEEEEEDVWTF